jgi:S-adenosylmethionine:tRNA ribosyltransferase-isomerase
MKLEEFDYNLPENLIAQYPLTRRDRSRLMVFHRANGKVEHRSFSDITDYLKEGDILLLNDTKVIPARLFGRKATGGKVEVLLLQKLEVQGMAQVWRSMVKPSRGIKAGIAVHFDMGLRGEVIGKSEMGCWDIKISAPGRIEEVLSKVGMIPLPPYVKREATALDRERYQTVFARKDGAVAAPTAGLHFTNRLLKRVREMGVICLFITLHTSAGTFMPVRTTEIEKHRMMPEYFEIGKESFNIVKKGKSVGRRVIAVGSTTMRTLEGSVTHGWADPCLKGYTDLFIYPGYRFKVIDGLITNFHLPRSTLLMLVSAFAGKDNILNIYSEAANKGYRFYSYGDAMMII